MSYGGIVKKLKGWMYNYQQAIRFILVMICIAMRTSEFLKGIFHFGIWANSGQPQSLGGVLRSLYENWSQMIEKEQRPPNNSPNLNITEISGLGNDA